MEIIVKKDILDELQAKGVCHSREEADKFLKETLDVIEGNIKSGKKVHIQGFGSFLLVDAKMNKNPEIVENEALIEKISKSLSMDVERTEYSFELLFHFIKQMIIKGYEVQLIKFASFRIEERKAQVVKSPRTGRKVVMPAKKILVFEPEKTLSTKVDNKEIQFTPDEELREPIERLKTSNILFVVPNRDFFVKTIEYHFEKAGWKVNTSQSVEEAERFLNTFKPHLVILDSDVPNHQALCEIIKFKQETSLIPLIIMYPKGTDLKKTDYFRICGDEHISQPFEIKQLLKLSESVLRRISEEESIFKQEVLFQFPTVDKYMDKANELCGRLFAMSGMPVDEQLTIAAALREGIANAAQHGNKHRRDKLLEVLYLLDKEKIMLAITDSGFGFDWQKFLNINKSSDAVGRARQSHRDGKLGGLGIMLMLRCVDKIEYNDVGNVVTLTKYLK